jgi:hypothetical protein
MKTFLQKRGVRITAAAAACVLLVYALIYADVVLRARSAYLEGEKYWSWYSDPQKKMKALDAEFAKARAALEKQRSAGKLTQDQFTRQLDILSFNDRQKREESSIKYAYIWYQTTVELFSPPESKWVKLARRKMPDAKELWKRELAAKNIPFEDYMLE